MSSHKLRIEKTTHIEYGAIGVSVGVQMGSKTHKDAKEAAKYLQQKMEEKLLRGYEETSKEDVKLGSSGKFAQEDDKYKLKVLNMIEKQLAPSLKERQIISLLRKKTNMRKEAIAS